VVASNPAHAVRGPKHVVKTGKTTALSGEQARELLDSIDVSTLVGLRDRVLIAVMTFAFARIGAVVAMRVGDYFPKDKRWWVRLHEKGGKRHEMPAHHNLEAYLDAYIEAAKTRDAGKAPLFRSAVGRTGVLTETPMSCVDAWRMVQRRAADLGTRVRIVCYWLSLRATATAFNVAFVIGNSSYGAAGSFPNPVVSTECDRLAAIPFDSDLPKGFPGGLKWEEINPDAAIPACRRALENTPGDRRVRFQLGRALQSGKKFEEARSSCGRCPVFRPARFAPTHRNPSYKDAADRMYDGKDLPSDSEEKEAVERAKAADDGKEASRRAEQQFDRWRSVW
jgi:hypothetical protein